jgi:hypothetical protein
MVGYRLGNGTEADARAHRDRGLPPVWSPLRPWHYFTFGYWACTFSYSNLDLSKKYDSMADKNQLIFASPLLDTRILASD